MKRNALIRIVLWSILLVVLVSILSISLLPKTPRAEATVAAVTEPKPIPVETTVPSAPADPDALSGPNYPAQKIRELEIDWVIGNIMIIPTETDQILIYETNVTDPKDAMVVELEEGSLSIEYCKNWKKIPSFGTDVPQKDLTIYVPYDWNCSNIEINAASANLNVTGLTAGEVDIESASGQCTFSDCDIRELDIQTASGDILYTGSLQELDCEAASANVTAELTNVPRQMKLQAVSGNLNITLPQNAGFTLNVNALNDQFYTNFDNVTQKNGQHIRGDGSCRITIKAMSGRVEITKGQ